MATIEYELRITDRPGEHIILTAEWINEEGAWRTSVPITRRTVEYSNFDVVGREIRDLEERIRRRNKDHKVVQSSLELPQGWSSYRGPDSMLTRKERRQVSQQREQENDNERTPKLG